MIDAEARVYSVSELTELVKGLLEESFPRITVEGEISNCRPASSGHLYFSLKDRSSLIQAVMFRYKPKCPGFEPADGMLVKAQGTVTVYAARGQYQLLVERMERAGAGDLLALLEDRKRRLAAEGLFDEERKRPLPRFPSRVAVVTSPTGAAIRDILNVLKRRNSGLDVVVLPAAVQGEAAPEEIVRQIRTANMLRMGDVIIVGRGGGSLEDLLAFSDEEVVRAVAASEIPVISAVGHDIDWALTDYAADLRAPTPSAAAELVSESRDALKKETAQHRWEIETAMRSRLERARHTLEKFEPSAVEARFMRMAMPVLRRFDEAKEGLVSGLEDRLRAERHRLELARRDLEAASPEAILSRGYAVVRKAGSKEAVREAAQLVPDERIEIRFKTGGASARVEEVRA